jgi:hypothetical protein
LGHCLESNMYLLTRRDILIVDICMLEQPKTMQAPSPAEHQRLVDTLMRELAAKDVIIATLQKQLAEQVATAGRRS